MWFSLSLSVNRPLPAFVNDACFKDSLPLMYFTFKKFWTFQNNFHFFVILRIICNLVAKVTISIQSFIAKIITLGPAYNEHLRLQKSAVCAIIVKTNIFNTVVNDRKKITSYGRVLVASELVVIGTQCVKWISVVVL